ncbi:MAG: helix-turn-helix domain-containing protein [Xanthobacteraceae bacterium]|nr:helix-turn-helix domain-containing protein [Xanthobacteraceae bacterium]
MAQRQARARRADLRDAEVGRRVRARRLERGITQTELATRIGVTFQQVQKYEKGVNRIGAGRLQRISEALDVPVTFFFGGAEAPVTASSDDASVFGYLQTSGAIRIVKAFYRIKDRRTRQLLVELAERIAGGKD